MSKRELTICKTYTCSDKKIPVLHLQGRWLEASGFEIGKKITVEEKQGELVLKLIEASN